MLMDMGKKVGKGNIELEMARCSSNYLYDLGDPVHFMLDP